MTVVIAPPQAPERTVTERARFGDLLASEWIKLWSLRSTYWSVGLIAVSIIGFSANAAGADYRNWPSYSPAAKDFFNGIHDAFPQQAYLLVVLAAASIGAITIVGEYASGLIRTTFAAVPDRRAVMAAKIGVVSGVMLVIGVVSSAAAFWVSQAILSARHAGSSIADQGALRAVTASALLVPASALAGMAFGALIRHIAPSIVTGAAALLLLPTALDSRRLWEAHILHAMLIPAWQRLVDPEQFVQWQANPATVTGSWIVFAVWPIAAAMIVVVAVDRRDL